MLLRASASKQRLPTSSLVATYPQHKVPWQHSLCTLTWLNSMYQRCSEMLYLMLGSALNFCLLSETGLGKGEGVPIDRVWRGPNSPSCLGAANKVHCVVLHYVCKVRVWKNSTTEEWPLLADFRSLQCPATTGVGEKWSYGHIPRLRLFSETQAVIVLAYFVGNNVFMQTNSCFLLFFYLSSCVIYLVSEYSLACVTQEYPTRVFQSFIIRESQIINRLYHNQEGLEQTLQRNKYLLCVISLSKTSIRISALTTGIITGVEQWTSELSFTRKDKGEDSPWW